MIFDGLPALCSVNTAPFHPSAIPLVHAAVIGYNAPVALCVPLWRVFCVRPMMGPARERQWRTGQIQGLRRVLCVPLRLGITNTVIF